MRQKTLAAVDTLPVEPMLQAVSTELASAREVALELQGTVSELVTRIGGPSGGADVLELLLRLQELDRLTQTLEDLSRFTASLARSGATGGGFDAVTAAGGLQLRDLADRLTGRGPAQSELEPPPDDDVLF